VGQRLSLPLRLRVNYPFTREVEEITDDEDRRRYQEVAVAAKAE